MPAGRPKEVIRGKSICTFYRKGRSVKWIAQYWSLSTRTILYYLHSRKVKLRVNKRKEGVCVHPERLKEMKKMYKEGQSVKQIGDAFDMSSQGVHNFLVRWGVTMRPRGRKKGSVV